MTFCESIAQPVRLNAHLEAVRHGHPKLLIPMRSCKFYICSVVYLFLFALVRDM